MPSAQSGITAWREARTAATSSAPMPTVRKIFAWPTPTERSVAGARTAARSVASAATAGSGRSGMRAATSAASTSAPTPAQ